MKTKTCPDTTLESVKQRLEEWAEWYSNEYASGLGYSRCPLVFNNAGSKQHLFTSSVLRSHPAAEEIESLVNEMAQQNPLMARALRQHYFYPAPLRRQAVQLQMSYTQFKYHIDMAHHWLAGRFSSKLREKIEEIEELF